MHSALTGVQLLVTRTPEHAHRLAHICWGLLIMTAEKRKAIDISYSVASSFCSFFLGFHIVTTGNVFFMIDYDKKEKEHQNTRQSD
jgi:hypothetical protein